MSAAFVLLLACGDDSGGPTREGPDAGEPDAPTAESKRDEDDPAAPSGEDEAKGNDEKSKPDDKKTTPKKDESVDKETTATNNEDGEFLSAEVSPVGLSSASSAVPRSAGVMMAPASTPTSAAESSGQSTASKPASQNAVERGDIYRVLSDKRILNLNTYRGLQVLDVSDLDNPRIEGRLPVAATPVEMYVLGTRAFVLLNNWAGYYGSRDDLKIRAASGGLVMSVDISDRANPKLIDQAEIKGNISTSRLTQGSDGQAALYVAGTYYDQESHTIVRSFEVSTGELVAKSELDLGGQVQDIQATTDLMMVASSEYTEMAQVSTVTVIDISRTDGTMVEGGSVKAQGWVSSKFNMDAYNGVLRVVSGAGWGTSQQNRLETFSLSDLQNLEPIDSCQLTPRDPSRNNEQLFASVFIENRAFFVTYFRQDPFHAFSIDDEGHCEEHTQFIVSGWNDFLRPVLDDSRLLGIGHNDQNNWRLLSVSLYDADNLDNAEPLLARADIELNGAYSEANWDDRAFSVLENAVSVGAEDGTEETGLLLLPFSGWDTTQQSALAKVQLFTFSDHTLTKRGTMDHSSPVRRSFGVDADTTGNLSDVTLGLFDTSDPDQPEELSSLDLAPNHTRVLVYGDHVARLRDNHGFTRVLGQKPTNTLQIVAAAGDVENNPVLASFDVPAGANLTQVGDQLVSAFSETQYDDKGENPKTTTQIQVWDLKDPVKPRQRGALETDRLQSVPQFPSGRVSARCFECPGPLLGVPSTGYVVGNAIVFANTKPEAKSQGFVTQCDTYPSNRDCEVNSEGEVSCENPYLSGGITCITPDGGEERCSGQFYECDDSKNECKKVDPPKFSNRACDHFEQFRHWSSYSFDALDLRNPDEPTLAKRIELDADEEGTSLIAVGDTLYFNFQRPYVKKDDARSYVKHYVRRLGFADPQRASVSDPINIPGDVIAAEDETVYTRDLVWNDQSARTRIARLGVEEGKAKLQASKVFEGREVSQVKLDLAGHILVSSDPAFDPTRPTPTVPAARPTVRPPGSPPRPQLAETAPADSPKSKLSILNDQDLSVLGETELDSWATFTDAKRGLALYQVRGGLLVINVKDAAKPKAQAYFPVAGWPSDIVFDGDAILFAAGLYGVHRLDADVFNLLMQ